MGRKSTQPDKRARRYIRIEDESKWEVIDKLSALDEYKNSFNKLINAALVYGLPKLYAAEFGETEEDDIAKPKPKEQDITGEHLLQIIRLLREVVINETINKSLVCSLFQIKSMELGESAVGKQFSKGHFQDTPDCMSNYEIRELKKLRD